MEFPDLGERCTWTECQALEFLPFNCSFCNKIFCKDHFNPGKHECQSVLQETPPTLNSAIKKFQCSMEGCNTSDNVQMLCVKCSSHYCLAHRYHSCFNISEEEIVAARKKMSLPKEAFEKSLKVVNAKLDEQIERNKKRAKNQETAMKVQLMRLKGKAVGLSSIPAADRIYFQIFLPLSLKATSKAIFVSKDWTVGRVIDGVATACNVPNRNNQADASKLRLFKKSDGKPLATDMSFKLENLLNASTVSNGEPLILEYIRECSDEGIVLTDVSKYTDK